MTNLGSLNGGSSADSEAFDINSTTKVVGLSTFVGGGGLLNPHAALWQNGQITDLNKVIPKNSGWELSKAFGINDTGYIVGSGSINNQHHAFLAIPPSMAPATLTAAKSTTGTVATHSLRSTQAGPLLAEALTRRQAVGVDTPPLHSLGGTTPGLASGNTIGVAVATEQKVTLRPCPLGQHPPNTERRFVG